MACLPVFYTRRGGWMSGRVSEETAFLPWRDREGRQNDWDLIRPKRIFRKIINNNNNNNNNIRREKLIIITTTTSTNSFPVTKRRRCVDPVGGVGPVREDGNKNIPAHPLWPTDGGTRNAKSGALAHPRPEKDTWKTRGFSVACCNDFVSLRRDRRPAITIIIIKKRKRVIFTIKIIININRNGSSRDPIFFVVGFFFQCWRDVDDDYAPSLIARPSVTTAAAVPFSTRVRCAAVEVV